MEITREERHDLLCQEIELITLEIRRLEAQRRKHENEARDIRMAQTRDFMKAQQESEA